MRSSSFSLCLIALSTGNSASAFTTSLPGGAIAGQRSNVALSAHDTSPCDRSTFLKTSLASIAAITLASPAVADDTTVDDLAMPSAEEQKAADVS